MDMRMRSLTAAAFAIGVAFAVFAGVARGGLNWTPDDGCRTGLSADGYFYAAGPEAYWVVTTGGWNNCHLATSTTTGPLSNYAEWYLPIDTSYNGTYNNRAYVSNAGPAPLTTEAEYLLWGNGHSGGVTQAQILDQSANQSGFCYIFGPNTTMNGSNGGLAEIVDQNTRADGYIYVDVFCFAAQ